MAALTRAQLNTIWVTGYTPTQTDFQNLFLSFYNLLDNPTIITLTDAATITWNTALGYNAVVTLGGNRALSMTNLVAGNYYTLKVIQDGTGSRTMSLPASSKVINAGAGVITLTTTANAIDVLTAYYDGAYLLWNYGLTYT